VTEDSADRLGRDAIAALRAIALRAEAARRLDLGSAEAVLRSVVDATVALFQAEAASIALYDAATDRLVFRVAAGEQGQGVVGLSVPPSQGLVGYVYTTGQALALSDVERDARFGRAFAGQTGYVPRSIVAVPLVDEHGTIGVLEVLDKRNEVAFSLRDIELASVFARQAAVAISASRVERDVASLLATVIAALAGTDAADPTVASGVDELIAVAMAGLEGDEGSPLWALVEQVARVRRADPGQLELVADLLAVLADHAERGARGRSRRR
jgi:signal transduction protein with GAF and PtsI domain